MAKGIDINGQLRGKRGGVVYYRTNGQQISRARNFAPKNPKTDKQLIQRAVTATIAQMYSAGKMIFDHSFEGKAVPAGSMREFMKLNMNALRTAIIADINGAAGADDPAEYEAGMRHYVVNPSRDTPTPGQYIISKGTYKDSVLSLEIATGSVYLGFPGVTSGITTVADYMAAYNMIPGDIHTVCFLTSKITDFSRVSSPTSHFGFIRLIVKSGIDGTIEMATAKVSDIFEVQAYHAAQDVVNNVANYVIINANGVALTRVDWIDPTNFEPSAAGIICSRDDEKLRSNTVMQIVPITNTASMDNWSVTGVSLVESWRNASGDVQSDLILEGGNF